MDIVHRYGVSKNHWRVLIRSWFFTQRCCKTSLQRKEEVNQNKWRRHNNILLLSFVLISFSFFLYFSQLDVSICGFCNFVEMDSGLS